MRCLTIQDSFSHMIYNAGPRTVYDVSVTWHVQHVDGLGALLVARQRVRAQWLQQLPWLPLSLAAKCASI